MFNMQISGHCTSNFNFKIIYKLASCVLMLFSSLTTKSTRSTENKSGYSLVYITACVLFGSMAMLVKEHGITVFGICIVYDCLVIHKMSFWRWRLVLTFLCLIWKCVCWNHKEKRSFPPSSVNVKWDKFIFLFAQVFEK